jgi:pimeloyl-ACP methyl ester carboxylesterase
VNLEFGLVPTSFNYLSSDGTCIRGWRGDGEGPPVIISNGLGTIPQAWPGLLSADSGYTVRTWYYRGTFGSERPMDPHRIRVEDHVADLIALMDTEGIDRALVAGWSIGVNIAFEMAERHPDRVAGLMAVAGVPGGTFGTMGAPLRIPRRLRRPVATQAAKLLRNAGGLLTPLANHIPVNDRLAWLVTHSGFMLPAAKPDVVTPMLEEFLKQDWRWYMKLAVAAAEHQPMDVSFVRCPTTLVAGKWDVLTSMDDVIDTAARIPQAQITVLPGSHFLPMEYPELIATALRELARRSDLAAA